MCLLVNIYDNVSHLKNLLIKNYLLWLLFHYIGNYWGLKINRVNENVTVSELCVSKRYRSFSVIMGLSKTETHSEEVLFRE